MFLLSEIERFKENTETLIELKRSEFMDYNFDVMGDESFVDTIDETEFTLIVGKNKKDIESEYKQKLEELVRIAVDLNSYIAKEFVLCDMGLTAEIKIDKNSLDFKKKMYNAVKDAKEILDLAFKLAQLNIDAENCEKNGELKVSDSLWFSHNL